MCVGCVWDVCDADFVLSSAFLCCELMKTIVMFGVNFAVLMKAVLLARIVLIIVSSTSVLVEAIAISATIIPAGNLFL